MLTVHVCRTLSIVVFLFIPEILFSAAWYQGACNSPGVSPEFYCIQPLKQAYPGHNVPAAWEGGGLEGTEGKNVSIKASIIIEG